MLFHVHTNLFRCVFQDVSQRYFHLQVQEQARLAIEAEDELAQAQAAAGR